MMDTDNSQKIASPSSLSLSHVHIYHKGVELVMLTWTKGRTARNALKRCQLNSDGGSRSNQTELLMLRGLHTDQS